MDIAEVNVNYINVNVNYIRKEVCPRLHQTFPLDLKNVSEIIQKFIAAKISRVFQTMDILRIVDANRRHTVYLCYICLHNVIVVFRVIA